MSFNSLSNDEQRMFAKLLVQRRRAHERFFWRSEFDTSKDILIVGDRPGPKAPQTDNYHHTPFYHKIYSGGWITAQLVKAGITEDRLFWINSATWDGKPTDESVLHFHEWKHILVLGGLAEKWVKPSDVSYIKFDHPQAHKRFKSKEAYPFIDHLKKILSKT